MKKLVLALAAVAMIATPALADVTPYGSARIAAVYASTDDGATTTDALNILLQENTRFGIKANTGDVTGRIEIGLRGLNYVRLAYGTVKLGEGTFLVGQTYTPQTKFSNQALNQDLGFIGFGALYDGRQPMLKYNMDNGLYFAAIENDKLIADGDLIPKLIAGYMGKGGGITYNVGVAYQSYEEAVNANKVQSYLAFVCGDAKFGDWAFIYGLHYGQNLGDYGILGRSDAADYVLANDSDSTGYGLMLEADIAGWAFGVGYTADDQDELGADSDAQMAVFVNYTAQIAKGFKIVPEVTYVDWMEDSAGVDEGDLFLVGAKFQMDF